MLVTSVTAQVPSHAISLNPSVTTALGWPLLAQTGDTAHCFQWWRGPLGSLDGMVLYARSADGGRTWPVREQPLGTFSFLDAIASGPSLLVAVGEVQAIGPMLVRSIDDGATWSTPVHVGATASWQPVRMLPCVHVDGATVTVVWSQSQLIGQVWANRSTDGGATWPNPPTRLDVGVPATAVWPSLLRLVANAATLQVFWVYQPTLTSTVTAQQRSIDGGQTWLPAAQVLLPGPIADATGDGTILLLAPGDSSLRRSTDGGVTWNPSASPGIAAIVDLASNGTTALAVGNNGSTTSPTMVVNTSPDLGLTWGAPLVLPTYALFRPTAHVLGTALYVHFQHPVDPLDPGLVIFSGNGGSTWRAISGPVNRAFSPGERRNLNVTQQGPDFLAYVALGHTPRGSSTAGTGGIAPTLAGAGLPMLGTTTTLVVDDAVGGSLAVLGLSFGAPAPTPLGSATIWLQAPMVLTGFATGGTLGGAGSGTFSLPIVIPNHVVFAGTRFVSQAAIVDGAGVGGLAVTNAMETWVR